MVLMKPKFGRRLLSIWSHRKIIAHNYLVLIPKVAKSMPLKFVRRMLMVLYEKKMITRNSTIDNMPTMRNGGKGIGLFNSLYNLGIAPVKTSPSSLYQLPIFNHGDGTATIFLEYRPQGFYAVVNNAIDSAYQCVLLGLLPRFVWGKCSLYFDPHMGTNVWEYFFKQPSSLPSLHCCIPFPLI